jgi:glycerate 2-kinase
VPRELRRERPIVLAAPDSFKGTFPAPAVASAIAAGVESAGCSAKLCPLADGGEGTAEVLRTVLGGETRTAPAHDPLGRLIVAEFSLQAGSDLAAVDLASASGLALLAESEYNPEIATTYGTGELIAAAFSLGVDKVVLAAGGSATVDGGRGAIEALVAARIKSPSIEVLCDTLTPYELAAEVFGPQKGANPNPDQVAHLREGLAAFATELPRDPRGMPMGGAAGGVAGGLWAAYGARLRSGPQAVFEALDLAALVKDADLVISGEGQLDEQSLHGKLIGELARLCEECQTPLHVIVGSDRLAGPTAIRAGIQSVREATSLREIQRAAAELAESDSQ